MKRTSWLLAVLVVGATAAMLACGAAQPPTAPSFGPSSGGGVGPSPGGGVGPGTGGGVGPSPGGGVGPGGGGGVGPSPGGGVGPGGGGGGPSPTPTPNPSPTPTPTPSTCPKTHATYSFTGPFDANGGGNGPEIVVTDLPNCVVKQVKRVSVFITTATDLAVHNDPAIAFFKLGEVITFDLLEPVQQGVTLGGPKLGSACNGLNFVDAAPSFTTATQPYDGTFAPDGDCCGGGVGTFDVFKGVAGNGTWELPLYRLDETMTVQCWEFELDLENAP